jgi:hypothetical protein
VNSSSQPRMCRVGLGWLGSIALLFLELFLYWGLITVGRRQAAAGLRWGSVGTWGRSQQYQRPA